MAPLDRRTFLQAGFALTGVGALGLSGVVCAKPQVEPLPSDAPDATATSSTATSSTATSTTAALGPFDRPPDPARYYEFHSALYPHDEPFRRLAVVKVLRNRVHAQRDQADSTLYHFQSALITAFEVCRFVDVHEGEVMRLLDPKGYDPDVCFVERVVRDGAGEVAFVVDILSAADPRNPFTRFDVVRT